MTKMTNRKTRKMEQRADFKEGGKGIFTSSCPAEVVVAMETEPRRLSALFVGKRGGSEWKRGECALGANGSSPVTLFPHAHSSGVNKVAQPSPDKH